LSFGQTTLTTEERLQKSRIQLLMNHPFFGHLALYLKLVETKSIPTGATDGKRYLYNPDFVNGLSEKELNFLTAHETLHPALGHIWRGEGKDRLIFNHATDFVINGMIKEVDPHENTFKMIKGGLYDEKFKGLSSEEIYDILINDDDYVKKAKQNFMNGNGGTIDDHSIWEEADGVGNSSGDGEEDWKGRVVQASQVAEGKGQGKLPALIKRMIKDFTAPQKNWKQMLAEFVEQEINDYGFNPPDRRFSDSDFILPDFSEPEDVIKNLVFAVDTSGSIGEKEFQIFISEIVGCVAQFGGKVKGTLIYCDADIPENGVYDLDDAHKSLPVGGGGTDFRPVFRWIKDNLDDDCAGLIYLTDSYGSFPDKAPSYPTLWVLTTDEDVPFGIKTRIQV
jgi:predicted metal-dependent peptidase